MLAPNIPSRQTAAPIYELSVLMKVKPPFKKIEHEWMRSVYFGEKKKVDKNDPIYTLDGIVCEFDPVDADSQHHIRQALIKKITNYCGEVMDILILER